MDYSPPGSSVRGILQARILEWVAMPSSSGSSWPRDWTCVSFDSCIAGRFFTTESLGKPQNNPNMHKFPQESVLTNLHASRWPWSLHSVGILLWAIVPYPAAREVGGELAERLVSQGMPTLLVWEIEPNLEHFNSCQKIVQDNSNVNALQYLSAWVIWGRDWLNTKWTRKQLPEKTVTLFSASPGNTALLEMLNLLVRKDFRDHTIYASPARKWCQVGSTWWGGHGNGKEQDTFLCNNQKTSTWLSGMCIFIYHAKLYNGCGKSSLATQHDLGYNKKKCTF